MKVALLYGSTHGRTRKVVEEILRQIAVKPDVIDVKAKPDPEKFSGYETLFFCVPTYGDEELQEDMEEFLQTLNLDLAGKSFVIAELGNYYGYDDYSFGAMAILRRRLLELHGTELCQPLSLDSLPKVNWNQLARWVEHLNTKLKSHDRSGNASTN